MPYGAYGTPRGTEVTPAPLRWFRGTRLAHFGSSSVPVRVPRYPHGPILTRLPEAGCTRRGRVHNACSVAGSARSQARTRPGTVGASGSRGKEHKQPRRRPVSDRAAPRRLRASANMPAACSPTPSADAARPSLRLAVGPQGGRGRVRPSPPAGASARPLVRSARAFGHAAGMSSSALRPSSLPPPRPPPASSPARARRRPRFARRARPASGCLRTCPRHVLRRPPAALGAPRFAGPAAGCSLGHSVASPRSRTSRSRGALPHARRVGFARPDEAHASPSRARRRRAPGRSSGTAAMTPRCPESRRAHARWKRTIASNRGPPHGRPLPAGHRSGHAVPRPPTTGAARPRAPTADDRQKAQPDLELPTIPTHPIKHRFNVVLK